MVEAICKIRELNRNIQKFEDNFINEFNLCLNEGMLLYLLLQKERLTSGELAGLLSLMPSNASKVIRSLETKGLIDRELCEEDYRKMFFLLTEEGKKQIEIISCSSMEIPNWLKQLMN